jgi:hypothetical protein
MLQKSCEADFEMQFTPLRLLSIQILRQCNNRVSDTFHMLYGRSSIASSCFAGLYLEFSARASVFATRYFDTAEVVASSLRRGLISALASVQALNHGRYRLTVLDATRFPERMQTLIVAT